MNPQVVTKQIGRHTYGCRKMPAGLGLRVLARLMNLIGPSIKASKEEGDTLSNVVSGLLANEKLGDQLEYFSQTFAQHSTLEEAGRSQELAPIYDVHFSCNYFELVQWLIFCFEVNHGGFLAEAGVSVQSLLSLAQRELSLRSQKQPVKPGPSGRSSSPGDSTKPTATSTTAGQ